jgi:hypothetical protein
MYRYVESKSLCHTEFKEHALVLKWPATNLRNWSKKKTTNEDEVQTTQEKQTEKPGSVFYNVSKTPLSSPWNERLLLGTKDRVFFLPNNRNFFSPFSFSVKTCLGGCFKNKKKESPIHFFSFFLLPVITIINFFFGAGPQPPAFYPYMYFKGGNWDWNH